MTWWIIWRRFQIKGCLVNLRPLVSLNFEAHVPSFSDAKLSVRQVFARLRQVHQPDHKALAEALHISYTTYLKIERDQRDLSFLMALRICQFYQLDLHEFISMLSEAELDRHDRSIIRDQEKGEKKRGSLKGQGYRYEDKAGCSSFAFITQALLTPFSWLPNFNTRKQAYRLNIFARYLCSSVSRRSFWVFVL